MRGETVPRGVRNVILALRVSVFALACLLAAPIILWQFAVAGLRHWIETQWPDSERAQSVSSLIGFLAPLILLIVVAVVFGFAIAWVRSIKANRGLM
jgi:hypothetical protein